MEDGLIVGIDLGDVITQVKCADVDTDWSISTVLCKKKQEDEWYIGKNAYSCVLQGGGILSDKLVSLVRKNGTATFEDVKYTGMDLLQMFLCEIFSMLKKETQREEIARVVLCVDYTEKTFLEKVEACVKGAGIAEDRVHIISREESFTYYILSQRKEIWNHDVGLFEFSKGGLNYFHLSAKRNLKELMIFSDSTRMEESFSPDVLVNASGKKLGDQILSSCAERMLHGKLFSAVILTGDGFERTDWAPGFMSVVGDKRRVYLEKNLFAQGCVSRAHELETGKKESSFTCVCDGHLESSVAMDVVYEGKEKRLMMVSAGAVWYETNAEAEFILDGDEGITFLIKSIKVGQEEKKVYIALEGFPKRPPRTTRISLAVSFLDAKTMKVQIKDLGFGELFPSSGVTLSREVML